MANRHLSLVVAFGCATTIFGQSVMEFPISVGPNSAMQPSISFDTVVWADDRAGLAQEYDIWGTRLTLPFIFPVTLAPGDQTNPHVHVGELALCVWEDYRWGPSPDVYGAVIGGPEFPISTTLLIEANPRCWEPLVTYEMGYVDSEEFDVWCYNRRLGQYQPICTAPGPQVTPDLFAHTFVWADNRPDPIESWWDIWTRDHRLPFERNLTHGPIPIVEGHPRISGQWCVFEREDPLTGFDIWAIQLEPPDAAPIAICRAPGDQRSPAIWGNIIVWEDRAMEHWLIMGHDLASRRTFKVSQITGMFTMDMEPEVSQNVVVWTRYDGFTPDVIGAQLDFSNMEGTVHLGNYLYPQKIPVDLELYGLGKQGPSVVSLCLNPVGAFKATTLLQGWYRITTKPSHWLRRTLPFPIRLAPGTTVSFELRLINGDVVNDNRVDLLDLNEVLVRFGQPAPNRADLDGSGLVDLADLNIVLINFGLQGDPPL